MSEHGNMQSSNSRRDFLKKVAYVSPAIVTLSVSPSVFAYGSGSRKCEKPEQTQANDRPRWRGRPIRRERRRRAFFQRND